MPELCPGTNRKRYRDFKTYLREQFGCSVYKLQIDAGFTCPNRDGSLGTGGCIYCDGRGSALRQRGLLPSVAAQIADAKELYRKLRGAKKYIAYFQTFTNTYGPCEKLKSLWDEALAQDDIVGLAVGTRPDCISDEVIALVDSYGGNSHVWIEYGLQSSHDRTLRFINRGHDYRTFVDAVERTAGKRILICAHIIVGLPGETREDILETARRLAALPIKGIKIHLALALEGTVMGRLFREGKISMISKDEYVKTVCDILEVLPPDMVIQRLTADGYRDIFLAPDWGRNKMQVINAIEREMERRDTFQGARFQAAKEKDIRRTD